MKLKTQKSLIPLVARFAVEIKGVKNHQTFHSNKMYRTDSFTYYPFYKPVSLLLKTPSIE